jgi:hypothetical protein
MATIWDIVLRWPRNRHRELSHQGVVKRYVSACRYTREGLGHQEDANYLTKTVVDDLCGR